MKRTTLAALLLAFAPAPAFGQVTTAPDFTITVPVEASGLPAGVNQMMTACQVLTNQNMPVVGAGSTSTAVTGRAFRGDVTVTVKAQASVDPATATRYSCSVWFIDQLRPGVSRVIYFSPGTTPDGGLFQNFPLVAGAPFKLETGILPLPPR